MIKNNNKTFELEAMIETMKTREKDLLEKIESM